MAKVLIILILVLLPFTQLTGYETKPVDLNSLTLDKIMDIKVITASKKLESLFSTCSAVYVVTAEDMKRRGVKSIPEALRGVPGVQVSKRSTNTWEVSIRGFDNLFSNKLLVLVDGRSVYTPIFSGVYWSMVNYPIADIKRIEVVRGPGATVWGSNAVNGVINIITKNSDETLGTYLQAEYGTESHSQTFRYGFSPDKENKFSMRLYGHRQKVETLDHGIRRGASGDNEDDWDHFQAGMRMDYRITNFDSLRLSADGFRQSYTALNSLAQSRVFHDSEASGFNTVGEYIKELAPGESLKAKVYYDYSHLNESGTLSHKTHTWDGAVTYNFILGERNYITLGGGTRIVNSVVEDSSGTLNIQPRRESVINHNVFLQDKITLIDSKLHLTLGMKVDFMEYTGAEYQPSAKLSYQPNENNIFWLSVSRSSRSPSRYENDSTLFNVIVGNHDVDSEKLKAYELGYRRKFEKLTLTSTIFYFEYDDLVQIDTSTLPRNLINVGSAESYGFEMAVDYDVLENWHLRMSYTYFDSDFQKPASTADILFYEDRNAKNKAAIHSYYELSKDIQWDISLYYSDRRDTYGTTDNRVHTYFKLDTRLAWQVNEKLEVYLLLKNLLDSSRRESGYTSEVPRSASIGLTYNF